MTANDRAALLASMSTAEKIETIVGSYLRSRTTSGACGSLVEFEPGCYRVEADGKCYIVNRATIGWCVSFKGFQGVDSDLCAAAMNALASDDGRDVSRNYRVAVSA